MFCRSRMLRVSALILLVVGTVQASVHHVERPDPMEGYFLMDVDRLGDRVRLLRRDLPHDGVTSVTEFYPEDFAIYGSLLTKEGSNRR